MFHKVAKASTLKGELNSSEILTEKLYSRGLQANFYDKLELLDGIYIRYPNSLFVKTIIYKPILEYHLFKNYGFEPFHLFFCDTLKSANLDEYRAVIVDKNKFFVNVKQNRADISIYRDKPLSICPQCLMKLNSNFNKELNSKTFDIKKHLQTSYLKANNELFDINPEEKTTQSFLKEWYKVRDFLLIVKNSYCLECNIKLKAPEFASLHYSISDELGGKTPKIELLCPVCHSKKSGHKEIKNSKIYKLFLNFKTQQIKNSKR
ncbi:MAG: hypothetical protein ACLFQJ_06160 [Campylobacterales bacterium]